MRRSLDESMEDLKIAISDLKAERDTANDKFLYYLNLECPHCGGSHNTGHHE